MTHSHNIADSGSHFVIDPVLRTIKSNVAEVVLVEGDHNSERYTFDIPRMVDGHDMSLSDRIEIHYDNIARNKKDISEGVYIANGITVKNDTLEFGWLITENVTKFAGTTKFWINFICLDDDENIIYSWGTDVFKSIRILSNNDNTESIIAKFPDVLSQWKEELLDEIGGGVTAEQIAQAVADYLEENPIDTGTIASIGVVELLADKWEGSNSLYSQKVSIDGVTKYSQVDLTPSVEQLVIFYEKDLTFVTENDGGVVTVYAIGQRPTNDYTIQVTITEVEV